MHRTTTPWIALTNHGCYLEFSDFRMPHIQSLYHVLEFKHTPTINQHIAKLMLIWLFSTYSQQKTVFPHPLHWFYKETTKIKFVSKLRLACLENQYNKWFNIRNIAAVREADTSLILKRPMSCILQGGWVRGRAAWESGRLTLGVLTLK